MGKGGRWEDHFTRRAKKENWRARSVYKLEEIDRRFKVFRPGYRVLDLGAFPGSWSQYSLKRVGAKGDVVGIDLKEPEHLEAPNFTFILADILTLAPGDLKQAIGPRDIVISDLAPRTTGIRVTDESRSLTLAVKALEIALAILRPKGNFLCKVFEGENLRSFKEELARGFKMVRAIRPSAVRKRSREIYLLGLERLDPQDPLER
ncbi:MAG: RlmE family RNA methyltransferase [Deltaproteobacteria bacterium]|nr:RlmE family RNA methyltransferase [Deltaproteobacteria bacterium]MBW2016526.1 RlmE family RNA methyltransferase [Deltaproteobacteria bacterium]MBW2128283.1 RlmE family RNA methyltransferase [Deltaproteobacteria bacterium]MBW2302278.1 RlmE family RNA methyltransferase [Deltaproteobacteria bacterium]